MPRYLRKGIKHGGVTGSTRPNSQRTKIIPGSNPRGDGKLQCGHAATQPERWLTRKVPRYEWDADLRRVCEACFQTAIADPDSIWRKVDPEGQTPEATPLHELERTNRALRVFANVLLRRLKYRPDWPLIQKLAGVCLAAEDLLNSDTAAGAEPRHELLYARLMDRDVVDFMIDMDRLGLLPDGSRDRRTALPSDLSVAGIMRTREPSVSLELQDKQEIEQTMIAGATGEPYSELARRGCTLKVAD